KIHLKDVVSRTTRCSVRCPGSCLTTGLTAGGRKILLRYPASTEFHHRAPPNTAIASMGTAIAVTTFARRFFTASNTPPGGTRLSPADARTIVTSPANNVAPSTRSNAPSAGDNDSRPVGTEFTGTIAVPLPFLPNAPTYTLYDPFAMSQSWPA